MCKASMSQKIKWTVTSIPSEQSPLGNARGTNKRRVDGNKKSGEINTLSN